jgi:hypothetical protein
MRADELTLKHEFQQWWAGYPLKVGKLAAEQKYRAARTKRKASAQDLLAGLAAYIANKPDWQAYANPATWLNQGRWMDDYSKPAPSSPPAKSIPAAYRPYIPLGDRVKLEDRDSGN